MTDREKLRCPECWGTGIQCWSTGIQPAFMSRSRECSKCGGTGQIEAPPPTSTAEQVEPCGGCGETDPAKRCINCFHVFTPATPEGMREAVTVIRDLLADEADGWDELDLPGLTVWIVPDKVNGGYCIRKWENHGLEGGTHRLVAEPLARREVEAAAALRQSPTVEEVARVIDPKAFDHPTVHPQHLARRRKEALIKAQAIADLYRGKRDE